MATYSRSQTTTQTSQSAAMPSMDISSLLVKTMENVMNDKEGSDKGFEESVTNGINNSDLLKDKTKKDTDKELADLLKDKKNSDKELSNLLKDTNKNAKESKKESSGKLVGASALGATIGALFKSKSIGQATGAVVGGAGKAAGGLISGIGNVGGSLIAGVGKLFGPIGGIIGKAVGAAVAVPFKAVGGLITGAIGGLAKLLSSPLKELVTKGALIVGVLSQLFVFLEGLLAKFIAQKDIKWIDFMSKLKSSISMIPSKLKLSLEQILSKVRIMGKPIFGAMTDDEEKELGELGTRAKFGDKNDPLYQYDQLLNNKKTGIAAKEQELQKLEATMQEEYTRATGGTLDLSKYNLNTTAGKEALKADWLSQLPEDERAAMTETINSRLSDYSYMSGSLNDAKKRAAYLEKTNSEIARYKELSDMANTPRTKEWYDEQMTKLDDEEAQKQADYFAQGLYNYSQKKGGLTEYQQDYANKLHAGSVDTVKGMYAANNEVLTTKDATGAERFLNNQYKAWTDSWSKAFKDFKQDIGIDIKQKVDRPNPNVSR